MTGLHNVGHSDAGLTEYLFLTRDAGSTQAPTSEELEA